MDNIKILRGIKPRYSRSLILTRLGYKRGATEFAGDMETILDKVIKEAEELCLLTLAYRVACVREHLDGCIELEDGTRLKGKALSGLLEQSGEVLLMASTAGPRVMESIRGLFERGRAGEAVIMDAAASEIADAGLDFVMDYASTHFRREGKALTQHRFSPGYGDFTIDQQMHFARLLDIGRLGISITETCILVPEKSVMAVAGVVPIN